MYPNKKKYDQEFPSLTETKEIKQRSAPAPIKVTSFFTEPSPPKELSELIKACEAGDINSVIQLHQQHNLQLDQKSSNNKYPLGAAVYGLNSDVIEYILAQMKTHDPDVLATHILHNKNVYPKTLPTLPEWTNLSMYNLRTLFRSCHKGGAYFSDWLREQNNLGNTFLIAAESIHQNFILNQATYVCLVYKNKTIKRYDIQQSSRTLSGMLRQQCGQNLPIGLVNNKDRQHLQSQYDTFIKQRVRIEAYLEKHLNLTIPNEDKTAEKPIDCTIPYF